MRCYNGCPDSQLQAYLDNQKRLHKELAKLGATATYFPEEQKWMVFKNHKAVTTFHSELAGAVHAYTSSLEVSHAGV